MLDLYTATGLTAGAAFLVSVAFVLLPPLRKWFSALEAETQQAVMGLVILIVAACGVFLGCSGAIAFIPCTVRDIGTYFLYVVLAAVVGDRTSKGVFAAARWVDMRTAEPYSAKALGSPSGKLLY